MDDDLILPHRYGELHTIDSFRVLFTETTVIIIPDSASSKHKRRVAVVGIRYTTVFNGTETVRKGQQKTSLYFGTV